MDKLTSILVLKLGYGKVIDRPLVSPRANKRKKCDCGCDGPYHRATMADDAGLASAKSKHRAVSDTCKSEATPPKFQKIPAK
jgi:hypothetical protein